MNISASNQSLENIIIRQEKEKKRPSFASVFEKINKRSANMNRITPLNNVLTNEQLFRYYLKETDPKLQVADDVFGEDEPTTLADLITNKSLNMSKVNQTIQTDDGDDDDDKGKEDASTQIEYVDNQLVPYNDEQLIDQSKSFVDRSSFLEPSGSTQREASKQLENSIESPFKSVESFEKNYENWYKSFGETRFKLKDTFNKIAENNAELGFANDEYKSSLNPMYEGSTDDFLSSIVGYSPDASSKKTEKLQDTLIEAGADPKEIESLSPIKTARTIKPVQPTKLVKQLVGAKETPSKINGPAPLSATWEDIRDHTAPELYYLQRGVAKPLSFESYRIRDDPLWRPTNKTGNWKDWAKAKYDRHDWYDDTLLDRSATAIKSAIKGHLVRNRAVRGHLVTKDSKFVNDLVNDVMDNAGNDAVSFTSVVKRGRPAGSKNKVITPTNMRTRSSKDTEGFV
jgi:hypothetical protein